MASVAIPTLVDLDRELCRRSLADFVREAWHVVEPGTPYVHGWHVDAIAEHLEAVTAGQITRLLINVPPGCMKSLLTAVFWPAWEWGPRVLPSIRFIGASHEEGLATRDNMKMRRLVTSDWYQARWPLPLTSDQNAKTYFENAKLGWRQSCPVRSMTGRRGDRVLWDDPHSVEDAHSDAKLKDATRIFRETLPTRVNDAKRSAIVVIMQRLNEDDVSGEILANDFGYVHLCLPMEFEPDRRCSTSIGFTDPRTEPGELLFPERFPREVVDRDKVIMGAYATAGQLQQRPSPLGGGILKGEWFGRYAAVPALLFRKIFGDTAQKTAEHNDYSVFQCWGKGVDGRAYLLDQIRGRWEAPELKRRAIDFWAKHQAAELEDEHVPPLRQMVIEDKASGTGLVQEIRKDGGIPIKGQERDRDKLTRVMDVAPQIEAGNALIPESAPWVSEFVGECEAFTPDDTHAHDDQVDVLAMAVADLLGRSSIYDRL